MAEMKPVQTLDLAGVPCPMNWVRTKLALEEMAGGEILAVVLDSGEPIRNVPQSAKLEGHKVIKVERLFDHYKLLIQRATENG